MPSSGRILADEDGVYDPQDTNDRLLLGLKGTISEFELVTMRNRLERGRLHKAQRGELFYRVPTGYVKLSTDRVEMDPDEQVREVIRLIFDKYDEIGSAWGVFHYLIRNNIRLGFRPFHGPNRGNLEWRRPVLIDRLRDPATPDLRRGLRLWPPHVQARPDGHGGTHRRRQVGPHGAVEGPEARLPAGLHHLGSLPGESRMLASAPIRSGLQGEPPRRLRAARRVADLRQLRSASAVVLPDPNRAYYNCVRYLHEGTEQVCFGLKAAVIDDLVTQQVLCALEPAALELSCRALEDVRRERARLDKHWKQRLERARYEAEDAERRYRAVDPENRLVARSLEQRWEETLRAERQVRDDYDRFLREQPPQLSQEERARIAALSSDLPALWHDPGTTHRDRKEIIRHLVEKVVVHGKNDSEYVDVTIHWQGGFISQHEVLRPVRSYEQLRDFDKLMDRITTLRREGKTTVQIADALNREGFSTPKRCGAFSAEIVNQLLKRRGLANEKTYTNPARAARVVAAEARRRDPGVRRQARRLGAPGVAPLPEDARSTPLGPLGRRAGGETTSQAGGPVPPRRRGVSVRTHHAEGTALTTPAVDPREGRPEDQRHLTMEALCLRLPVVGDDDDPALGGELPRDALPLQAPARRSARPRPSPPRSGTGT